MTINRARLILTVFVALAVALPAAAQTRANGGLDTAALTANIEKLLRANEGVEASLWLGGATGSAWFATDADQVRPTASAIKTFYLVELFSTYAGRLDHPLPGAEAVLRDDAHPAISHFSPAVREEIRRDLGGASVRRVAEVMIGKAPASNAVYNAAANLTTAVLGGPETLTALIRKRDPAFARVSARRYMLRDRAKPGDNEAPATAFAALYQRLASSQLQGIDAATTEAIHATLESRPDAKLGKHFTKSGSLATDPMTQVRAGWWHTANGPLVYVVMTTRRSPAPDGRDQSLRRLSETCEALRDMMAAAGWSSMTGDLAAQNIPATLRRMAVTMIPSDL